jgi:hypothetical protein
MKKPIYDKRFSLINLNMLVFLATVLPAIPGLSYADDGDLLWMQTYHNELKSIGKVVEQTDDGGFIIGCEYQRPDNWYRILVIKTDGEGDTLWTRCYGWGENINYEIGSIEQTSDGGYIIGGFWLRYFSEELDIGQAVLIKTDANGDTLWTRGYSREGERFLTYNCKTVHETSDGGYIIGGYMCKPDTLTNIYYYDGLVIRTDENGDSLWTRTYGEDIDTIDYAFYNTLETSDGSFIVGGYWQWLDWEVESYQKPFLMKLGADGDSLWAHTYRESWINSIYDLIITSDNGYAYCGAATIGNWRIDLMIGKTDSEGNELWYHEYRTDVDPSQTAVTHEATSIKQTGDNAYLVCGIKNYVQNDVSYRNPLILKADDTGDSIWLHNNYDQIGGAGLWSLELMNDGSFVVAGGTSPPGIGWTDALLAKLDLATGIDDDAVNLPGEFALLQNYPNPFNISTVISYELNHDTFVKLDIYDILGRSIKTLVDAKQPAGIHHVAWDAGGLVSGSYFYKLKAGDYNESKKMLLIK